MFDFKELDIRTIFGEKMKIIRANNSYYDFSIVLEEDGGELDSFSEKEILEILYEGEIKNGGEYIAINW